MMPKDIFIAVETLIHYQISITDSNYDILNKTWTLWQKNIEALRKGKDYI